MKKFKKFLLKWLIPIALGAAVGFLIIWLGRATGDNESSLVDAMSENSLFDAIIGFAIALSSLLIGFFLHIIIHEAGHLVGGKLSGYNFVSFRIGNSVFIRKDGKFVRKKFGVAGTDGQCLMSPPDVADEQYQYPFAFYNLSGGLANILISIPLFIIGILISGYLSIILLTFSISGTFLGLINLIPLELNGIANDGLNTINCHKNLNGRRAFWIQSKFAGLITQGIRVRDMPQEWVENVGVPVDALIGFLATLRCSYLLDEGELEQAVDYIKTTIENPGKMLELQKNELLCELLFCELVGECRTDEIEKLYTKTLHKHIKANSTHLSKYRLMYAYEKLYIRNETDFEKALADFERACEHTPFVGEIAGERELIERVNARSRVPNNHN